MRTPLLLDPFKLIAARGAKILAGWANEYALLARTLAPAPIARLLKDGRMAVAYLDMSTDSKGDLGWCCQMYHPDGRTSGSLGSDLNGCTVNSTPGDVERALRREFEKYTNGIDDVS